MPYHSQSNGQAERFVDTLKQALAKLKKEGKISEIINVFLSTYRTTPNPQLPKQKTFVEQLLDSRLCTTLDLLRPLIQSLTGLQMENQFNQQHGAK